MLRRSRRCPCANCIPLFDLCRAARILAYSVRISLCLGLSHLDSDAENDTIRSKPISQQTIEALEECSKKYSAASLEPTTLLEVLSDILAGHSVFLPDFSLEGVVAKIKLLYDRATGPISPQEQASLDKAMEEILDALVQDDSIPNSKRLFEQVIDALEICFRKYSVEARAPTTLLTSIAEILAEQSVFLPDFSPTGVVSKIKSLYDRPPGDMSVQERTSLDKAMEEILDALARDEDTRLLISASNENNSLGQMVFGSKNRNEYLETIRVYMVDETSKSFMVSVADTAFELLQRVLGKIHTFMKDLSGGYALWEVPFNAPGKQTLIGIDQCPVVLKRAWTRPTKIYFLTTEEAISRFNLAASSSTLGWNTNGLTSSTNDASLSSSLGASSSGGGAGGGGGGGGGNGNTVGVASSPTPGSMGRLNVGTPRSPSTPHSRSNIAHSVKVSIEDGNYVNLILGRGERCESIRRRAISKLGNLIDDTLTFGMWLQLSSTDSASPPASTTDDRKSPVRASSKLQKLELGLTLIPVLPDDDVGALIVKYSGSNKFLLKAEEFPTTSMTPRGTSSSTTDSIVMPMSAREFTKSTSAKNVLHSSGDSIISPRSTRHGSLISRSQTSMHQHTNSTASHQASSPRHLSAQHPSTTSRERNSSPRSSSGAKSGSKKGHSKSPHTHSSHGRRSTKTCSQRLPVYSLLVSEPLSVWRSEGVWNHALRRR